MSLSNKQSDVNSIHCFHCLSNMVCPIVWLVPSRGSWMFQPSNQERYVIYLTKMFVFSTFLGCLWLNLNYPRKLQHTHRAHPFGNQPKRPQWKESRLKKRLIGKGCKFWGVLFQPSSVCWFEPQPEWNDRLNQWNFFHFRWGRLCCMSNLWCWFGAAVRWWNSLSCLWPGEMIEPLEKRNATQSCGGLFWSSACIGDGHPMVKGWNVWGLHLLSYDFLHI